MRTGRGRGNTEKEDNNAEEESDHQHQFSCGQVQILRFISINSCLAVLLG